jgi:cytochrome c oxidase subunit 3
MTFLSKVMVKPWEHAGNVGDLPDQSAQELAASRTGLFVFLAVITSMFLLFIVSYYSRSRFPDWEVLRDPEILWINTAVLVLASTALQLASNAAKRDASVYLRNALIIGSVLTLVFIGGQFVAWEQMIAAGYYAAENPANAFFYLFTGLHALHLLGGMWFMLMLGFRLNRRDKKEQLRLSVALCATYWHYLLIVWLVLFTLLLST